MERTQESQYEQGTTFLRTCFNGVNMLSGVGLLTIPFALSRGWLGLVALLLVAMLCWYTGLLLQRCMTNEDIKSYPDIRQATFGWIGKLVVSVVLYLELYLVAVEFLILEGDNLSQLFPHMSFTILGHTFGSSQCFFIATSLVILPTTRLKNLGVLAYISAGGVLASLLLVVCVFWVGAVDNVGFHERSDLLRWKGLPTTLSLYLFCYCGHAVFPTLSSSMQKRSQFSKVLAVCFITSTINYGSMVVLGYLMFGEHLKSQVTLNLSVEKVSTKIAICITLVNPLTKYALVVTPIANAIEEIGYFRNRHVVISILLRTLIVISTVCVALTVPFFGYVMTFVGAFLSMAVAVLLPCVLYLKMNSDARVFGFELISILIFICIGLFVGVVGTYTSVKQIVHHL